MKKIRRILSIILLVGILCSCSSQSESAREPYLTEKERAKIEEGILNGLEFTVGEYDATASFRNNSDYTLLDVQFVADSTQIILCSTPYLEKNMSAELYVYLSTFEDVGSSANIYLVYTIGEYTYHSDLKVPIRKSEEDADAKALKTVPITISTKDGTKELDYSNALEFFSGTEILGLKQYRIFSILPNVPYDGSVEIHLTGKGTDDYRCDLIAKLLTEDGIVAASKSVYFSSDGTATIYIWDIEPGNYTLVFEETA